MNRRLTKPILAFWISWLSLLTLQTPVVTKLVSQSMPSQTPEIQERNSNCEKSIEMKIVNLPSGSGVIIHRSKDLRADQFNYIVATNHHVIKHNESPYQIETFDKKQHQAQLLSIDFGQTDLALLKFSATENYNPTILQPAFTKGLLQKDTPVMAVGYPGDQPITCLRGNLKALLPQSLLGGSQIGFSADVEFGMSGGALLNSQGQLMGIIQRTSYPITGYPDAYPLDEERKLPLIVPRELIYPSSWAIPIEILVTKAKQHNIDLYPAWNRDFPSLPVFNQPIITRFDQIQAKLDVKTNNFQLTEFILTVEQDNGEIFQDKFSLNIDKESIHKATLQVLDIDNDQAPEVIVNIQHNNRSCLYDTTSYIYRYNPDNQEYDQVIQHQWENVPFYHFEDMDNDGQLEIKSFDGNLTCAFTQKYNTHQQREALPLEIWRYSSDSNRLTLLKPSQFPQAYHNHALKLLSYYQQTPSDYWQSHTDELQALLAAYVKTKQSIDKDYQGLQEIKDFYPFKDQQEYFDNLEKLLNPK